MNREQFRTRLNLLASVQGWTLVNNRGLTVGQRICLSQERGAIYRCLNHLAEFPDTHIDPRYTIPKHLEEKVQHIYNVIINTKKNE